VSFNKVGNVAVAQGKLEEAARAYGDALAIRKRLAAGDPSNAEWQRDLSVSYNKVGDLAKAQGKLEEAARYYGDGLAIAKRLAAGDPSNAEWQRDVYVFYFNLAGLAERRNKPDEVRGYCKEAFDILSGMEKRGLHLSSEDRAVLEILRKIVASEKGKRG
jgi:tetratricopeptide (TPR) repeat protein